jgi:Family of unknown function (DUF6452)
MQGRLVICILFFLTMLAFVACTGNRPCLKYSTVAGTASFKSSKDTVIRDSTLADVLLIYPTLNAQQQYKSTSRVNFILNPSVKETQILLASDTLSEPFDTLRIFTTPSLHFVSKECGYNYFFSIDSLSHTKNRIRKITLTDKAVNDNTGKTHMAILF